MSSLPFIVAAYGITILAVLVLSVAAWRRHGRARRRLAALEAESPRRRGRASR